MRGNENTGCVHSFPNFLLTTMEQPKKTEEK